MKGVVVCPQPRAAEEGSRILARGGNAIDAAVATAFVQAIVSPTRCGIGGFGNMFIYLAQTEQKVFIDFQARAGSGVSPEMWQDKILEVSGDTYLLQGNVNMIGYTSVAVPGTVRGLHEALSKYGTMSWREVIEPAIPYAEIGVPMDKETMALYTAPARAPGFPTGEQMLRATEGSRRIWYKEEGTPYAYGELRSNKDYARALKRLIDEGPDSFYTGSIAGEIVQDMRKNGGFITTDDLRKYKVRTYEPIQGSYRGYEVFVNRPPCCGIVLLELLNILEGYPLCQMRTDSVGYIWLLVQAMRAAHSDRVQYLTDEEFYSVPVEMLVSKERGDYWRKKIDAGERIVVPKPRLQPTHTTHVCVLDEVGNAVSLTHTNGTDSGCATLGLGFLYNNSMVQFHAIPGLPNSIAPAKARVTGMSPAMLFHDGKLVMVIGAPGGFKIPDAIAQSILNVVDHGMSMQEAISAARIHCQGGLIELEGRIRADVAEELRRKGNPVHHWPDSFPSMPVSALVHGIVIDAATGRWKPGADPRGNGGVAFSLGWSS